MIGPDDLKLPTKKALPARAMPQHAVALPHIQEQVTLEPAIPPSVPAENIAAADVEPVIHLSGAASPHGILPQPPQIGPGIVSTTGVDSGLAVGGSSQVEGTVK